MIYQRVLAHLLPPSEPDPKFREYLSRLGVTGLRTLAAVEIAAAFAQLSVRVAEGAGPIPPTVSMGLIGVLTLLASRSATARRFPRAIGALSAWLAPSVLMVPGGGDDYARMAVMLVLVTAAATIPFLPWQAFSIGMATEFVYILSTRRELSAPGVLRDPHHTMLFLLALLATGIAASNFAHRRSEHRAQQDAVRVAETLTGAQLRAQLAENAISIGKMSAALTHEINSPLGALRSSVDTLCALDDRLLETPPDARARLQESRLKLRCSIDESMARIDEVTRRLRRFINLEEAEVKSADVNDLLSDVSLLHRDEIERHHVRIDFDFEQGLPPLNCRPQLLTAAFSTLLSNAIQALNGDGRIAIQTRGRDGEVEVVIRDNGRGMSPEEADGIFDPSLKVAEGRVASGNWSLFNSRQIVYEHGGEIRVDTAPGAGTAMRVILPIA